MKRTFLKAKLHRATVTDSDLSYEGSISIDKNLCVAAGFLEFERVEIYNCNNGERFATYVIHGKDGEICINGAAARLVQRKDLVIICSYADLEEAEINTFAPTLIFLDDNNKPKLKAKHGLQTSSVNAVKVSTTISTGTAEDELATH